MGLQSNINLFLHTQGHYPLPGPMMRQTKMVTVLLYKSPQQNQRPIY